jgi:hypothetical protein
MSDSVRPVRSALILVATLHLAFVSFAANSVATSGTLMNRLEAFLDEQFVENPDLGLDDTIRLTDSEYRRLVPHHDSDALRRESDARLKELLDAAWFVAAFSLEPRHIARVEAAFEELARRRIAAPGQSTKLLEILVGARLLEKAHAFASRYSPDRIGAIPTIIDHAASTAIQTLLDLSDPTGTLHRRQFTMQPVQLIVVAHPGCGFTRAAARALAGDPRLADLIEAHATWIVPPSLESDFEPIRSWNRDNPDRQMRLVYRRSEWPMIDLGGVPQFYFLKEGVVVHHVRGWRDNGQLAQIAEGFERLGIMPPPSLP